MIEGERGNRIGTPGYQRCLRGSANTVRTTRAYSPPGIGHLSALAAAPDVTHGRSHAAGEKYCRTHVTDYKWSANDRHHVPDTLLAFLVHLQHGKARKRPRRWENKTDECGVNKTMMLANMIVEILRASMTGFARPHPHRRENLRVNAQLEGRYPME